MKRKIASKDFSISDLPSNRKEVFSDCLKNRYKYLMACGMAVFLTSIPLLLVCFLKSFYLLALLEELNNEIISNEDYYSATMMYTLLFDGLIVVSTLIVALGISGATRVIRQIGWEEPLFFGKDFADGIKMNYKYIVVHLLVLALMYLIADLSLQAELQFSLFRYIPIAIFLFIIIPLSLYNISQTNIYKMTNLSATKNSLLFLLKSVPACVVFSLVIILVMLINFIPNFVIKFLLYVLILIFLFPIYYLAWFLYSCSMFDKYINVNSYPELVDKGITRKENNE